MHAAAAATTTADAHAAEPNVKRLIAEIRKRPLLYSRDDPDYQNKQRKEECWQDIYHALDGQMSGEWGFGFAPRDDRLNRCICPSISLRNAVKQMKSKWTYLRDKLVKELKKNTRTLRKAESRWMYFDSMAFVRDANRHYM